MASQMELRLTVDVDRARRLISAALAEQGFTIQVASNGSLDVSRGSLGTTLVAGAFAGQDMHVRFDVDLAPSDSGSTAKVRSSGVSGFLKGGAIGASKANDAVQDAAHRLGVQLAAQGVLEGSTVVEPEPAGGQPAPYSAQPPAWSGGSIPAPVDYPNRTNVVAIVALILGFVLPIGGIIAGAVGLAQIKRTREKGRGLAIAGIAVGSALIVLLIILVSALFIIGFTAAQNSESQDVPVPLPSASSPTEESDPPADDSESVDVFSLAVGDCLNDSGADQVTSVEVVDCAQPHDLEVFTEFELEGDTFPGADQVDTLASDGCYEAFPGFVGIAYDDSVLDYTYFVPTQDSWDTGDDRLVSCLIGEPDAQTTGSLAGAAR